MTLSPGTRVDPYEIVSTIGAGGMGEVYRARDKRLGRDVAIKALPNLSVTDPAALGRFEREAQMLAALNHPHIAAIYGLEEVNATPFLILELVGGDRLAERLKGGPVPFAESLIIARQVADALQAAHEKGIVHRDLKPANIALTPDGQAPDGRWMAFTSNESGQNEVLSPRFQASETSGASPRTAAAGHGGGATVGKCSILPATDRSRP